MVLDRFKDLKVGDQVEFHDAQYMNDRLSGKGSVYGFGRMCMTDVAWVSIDDGKLLAIAYGDVKKV